MHILLVLITFTWAYASFGMEVKHDSLESYNMSALLATAKRQASQIADENTRLISLIEQIDGNSDRKRLVALNNVNGEDGLDIQLAKVNDQVGQLTSQNSELKKEKLTKEKVALLNKQKNLASLKYQLDFEKHKRHDEFRCTLATYGLTGLFLSVPATIVWGLSGQRSLWILSLPVGSMTLPLVVEKMFTPGKTEKEAEVENELQTTQDEIAFLRKTIQEEDSK